jgi:hypothetical protein
MYVCGCICICVCTGVYDVWVYTNTVSRCVDAKLWRENQAAEKAVMFVYYCMYICVYVSMYVYVYIHTYIHTYISRETGSRKRLLCFMYPGCMYMYRCMCMCV